MARRRSQSIRPNLTRIRTRERLYPIWSVRWVLIVGLLGFTLTAGLLLLLGPGRLIVRLEVTLAVIAAALFLFLTVGLYSGARVRKRENVAGELGSVSVSDVAAHAEASPTDIASGADDPIGCILGLIFGVLFSVLISVLLVVVITALLNVASALFFLLALTTGWLFQRALRQVFANSRRCRGNLPISLLYAGRYTVLYTGWLFVVLVLVDLVIKSRAA